MKPPPEDLVPVRVPAKRRHPVTDTNGSNSYLGVRRAEPATATQADEVFQQAFDGSTPDAVFQRLLGSVDILDFQATYWERECLQVARAVDDVAHLQHVFPWRELYAGDTQMKDVFSGQVECYKMRLPSLSKVPFLPGLCKNGSIMCMLLRRGFCITVNEPEGTKMGLLWRLIENLEAYFENIVHCLLVMTPTGSYCHHDEQDANKETFVLMLHGRMKWTLTHRGDGKQNIADDPTQDPVRKTFDMKAGDVLYVPNCYTRTAVDLADYDDGKASSVHVILSVRKDNNWSQYMEAVFPKLMHAAQKLDPVFRSPLPRDFLNITSADNPSCTPASTMVAQMLRKMADAIEYNPKMWDARNFSAPKVLQKFMSNRLPPHNFDGEELDRVLSVEPPLLTMQSRVRLKFPHHTMFLEQSPRDRNRPIDASGCSDEDGGGSDGDDDDDAGSREGGGAESPMMDAPAAQAAEDFPFPVGVGGDGDEADDAGNVYAPPAGDDDGSDSESVSDGGSEESGTEMDSTSDVDSVGAEMADNALVLYTSCFNDVRARWRSKHLRRMKPFVTSSAYAPALAYLKKAGSNYVAVHQLPVVGDSDSLRERIVADLYAGGLIDLLVDPGAFDVHYERKKQDLTAKRSKVYGGKSRKDSSSSDLDVD